MELKAKLLVLDDEPNLVKAIERLCKLEGYDVKGYTDHSQALETIGSWNPDVILLDVNMPVSGIDLLRHLTQIGVDSQIIIMTGQATIDIAVTALKEGAFDFVAKPFDNQQCLTLKIERALEHRELIRRASLASAEEPVDRFLIGASQAMQNLRKLIAKVGPTQGTALINGETGAGKELVARALHACSARAHKPFLAINCAAFSESLIESELFGHERGSFTGALTRRDGIFIEAHRGTLFLDEIGEMPLALQAKLLRVLQEGEVRRVGGNSAERVDVRLIAATNRNLQEEIKKGKFREDLFFRLNVINISVPPLRQRREDIALLAGHYLNQMQKETPAEERKRLSPKVLEFLERYRWPGNVRELVNVIQRALILAEGPEIMPRVLPSALLDAIELQGHPLGVRLDLGYQDAKQAFLEQFDREYVECLLAETGGSLSKASQLAQMDRSNFRKLFLRTGISTETGDAIET